MNEAGFWAKVREAINSYPRGRARKLTDAFTAGTPDCLYCINGVTGLLELKYVPKWPVRSSTMIEVSVTEEQRSYLEDWRDHARGRGYVLLGVEKDWFLLRVSEVPPAPAPGKAPRIQVMYLEGVRARGDGGTFKDLKERLPDVLFQLEPPQ